VAARAVALGLRRVHLLGWRDLEDAEAGGSELHAHRIASQWAAAGLDVTLRTSHVEGRGTFTRRDGYRVVRKSGRYAVFPRSAASGWLGRDGRPDGLVEIWNGMPFFSPVWAHCPRVVFLHHVHAEMWRMVLTPGLARIGEAVELRVAPPFYRRSRVVTLSASSRDEIVEMLGLRPSRVSVVAPGLDPGFEPGGTRERTPLVAAVGRLVPVKRFDLLIGALVRARRSQPALRAVIVGEGYERHRLEAMVEAFGAGEWISLPGHLSEDDLRDLYRRAWVVASTSLREGWGMTLTEAAACGTPAVATRIAGHMDAVADGVTGVLSGDTVAQFADALTAVLGDAALRARLGAGARERASSFTWEATAAGTLAALVDEAAARARRAPR
jgi:glycosyltransferase involved in cell wall biosynthesis